MPNKAPAARLREYRKLRDFARTEEPSGERKTKSKRQSKRAKQRMFVVQLHHASRRHFDFRLELDGVLRSWAVPKGPSMDPADKRLAVEVEDHPLAYADFEGTIPKGSYGAGVVETWDRGHWSSDGDPGAALLKGHLHLTLHGKRLKGDWALVRTGKTGKQWLLIKVKDRHATSSETSARTQTKAAPAAKSMRDYKVQLATLAEGVPSRGQWVYEIKYDGYRVLILKQGRVVHLVSRNHQDWTQKLAHIAAAAVLLPCKSCVIDGELVRWDEHGRSDFGLLQTAFGNHKVRRAEVMCFDLLALNGKDLQAQPWHERREHLQTLLDDAERPLRLSETMQGNAEEVLQAACKHELEGVIAKDTKARYRAGRNRSWLKLKCVGGDEFLAIGYTPGKGAREELGSLLLAEWGADGWQYCGRAGSGLNDATITKLRKLNTKVSKPTDIARLPTRTQLRGSKPIWLASRPVIEVNYRGRTRDGLLRQPAIKGIRIDKSPNNLKPNDSSQSKKVTTMLTHPDKLLFDDPNLSKQQLADYYRKLAPQLLRESGSRPLSLVRCPDGITSECFFQKHAGGGLSDAVKLVDIEDKHGKTTQYLWVDNVDGLIALVQLGTIELHVWGSKVDDLEHPDRIVFDLDPASDVPWNKVRDAARMLRDRLASIKLKSFLRTTGGKGLHVVVPITPGPDWNEVKAFAHAVAKAMAAESPQDFLSKASKSARKGRIFVDYLRNGRGATAIANYSVRARVGAPVATPLRWDELARIRSGDQYTVSNIGRRLAQMKSDPWKSIEKSRQKLPIL